ncbi:MAG: transglutaminase domain-containing protein [Planctomycetaceae bacterium]
MHAEFVANRANGSASIATDNDLEIRHRVTSGRRRTPAAAAAALTKTFQPASEAALHAMTVIMAILAMATFLITDADGGRSSFWLWFQFLAESCATVVGALVIRHRQKKQDLTSAIVPVLLVVAILSLLWEPFQRWALLYGRPFEMMVMHSQKNLMLTLAVFGFRSSCQRLSVFIGVALCVFCASVGRNVQIAWLIALFACSVISWLTATYWNGLQRRLLPTEHSSFPWRWLIIGPAIPLSALLIATAGGHDVIRSVRGYLPGSGGEGDYDEFSRGGVNDGDALVAGMNDIRSFGSIDDAPFADDDKPSLYDVINDQFDEPARKIKDQQRAVALPPGLMAETQARMAKSQQASREFSTDRKPSKSKSQRLRDLESAALFFVNGRVPVHLRMELYDVFDGVDWYPYPELTDGPRMAVVPTYGKPWLRIPCGSRGLGLHVHTDHHILRPVNLKTNVIPAPLDTRAVHIDKVEDSSLFAWHCDSIVRMNREILPELTPIHLQSDVIDPDLLPEHQDLRFSRQTEGTENTIPASIEMERIAALAAEWTQDVPDGYPKIRAICDHLRLEYTLGDSAPSPNDVHRAGADVAEEDESPLSRFLFRTKRGEQYLFATAAAVMIRSLGYSSRLVSGFYVSPEKYDAKKRHTPVHSSDAHFWCEVFVGLGTWVTIEATPGYEAPAPPPKFFERLLTSLLAGMQFLAKHWIWTTLTIVVSMTGVLYRVMIVDAIETTMCRWWPAADPAARLRRVARLLEHRLRRARLTRPAGMTLHRWIGRNLPTAGTVLPRYVSLSDIAMFGAPESLQSQTGDVHEVCDQVLGLISQKSLLDRKRGRQRTPEADKQLRL